jgi:sodium transport system permease protein
MGTAATVFGKEFKDAVRDRRTWLIVLFTSILAGPLTLLLLSIYVASVEESAAKREVYVANATAGPTLINFLQRAGATVKDAPEDYAAQIKSGRLQNAVIVVPPDFEARLAAGETIRLQVMFDETATRAQPSTRATLTAVRGFTRELGVQRLLSRGVSPQVLASVEVEELNVASSQSRGAQLLFLVPWLALLGSVAGAISVAIDVTAGERERGSLEPLLVNPAPRTAVAGGKWLAAAASAALSVALTTMLCLLMLRVIPLQDLGIRFRLAAPQVAWILAATLPLCLLSTAIQAYLSTFARSYKEAQTYMGYLIMLPALPGLFSSVYPIGSKPWMYPIPILGQHLLATDVLGGKPPAPMLFVLAAATALAAAFLLVLLTTRMLQREKVVFGR